MPGRNCCVPGCTWYSDKAKRTSQERSFFKILRPEFAKSDEDKKHRESLRNFILSLRDATQDERIMKQLHKESATICDVHFAKNDILIKGVKKHLRLGAIPVLNLPKSATKGCPYRIHIPKLKHASIEGFKKTAEQLSVSPKGRSISYERHHPYAVKLQQEKKLVPQIRNYIEPVSGLNSAAIQEIEHVVQEIDHLLEELEYACLSTFSQDVFEAFFGNLKRPDGCSESEDQDVTANFEIQSSGIS